MTLDPRLRGDDRSEMGDNESEQSGNNRTARISAALTKNTASEIEAPMNPNAQSKLILAAMALTLFGLGLWRYYFGPATSTDDAVLLSATAQPNYSSDRSGICRKLNNVLDAAEPGSPDALAAQLLAERNPAVTSVDGKSLCGYRIQFQYDGQWYEFPEAVDIVTGTRVSKVEARRDAEGNVFAKLPRQDMEVAVRPIKGPTSR